MDNLYKSDGFQGQIQFVIPRPILQTAARHLLVSSLYPTDAGYYPAAGHHYRERKTGAEQGILILCTKGQGWFEIKGKRRRLGKNEALFIPRGEAHSYGAGIRDPWTIYWLHFLGDEAPYYLALLGKGAHTLPVHAHLTPKIERLFHDVFGTLANGFSQSNLIASAHAVRHLFGLLFYGNPEFSPGLAGRQPQRLEGVIQFMRDRVDAPLALSEMAAHAGFSVTHFSRLFHQQTGFSPMDYFIHLKIQRACRFLTLTRLSIKEISTRIGYEDPYYFSRIFKKVMGFPPAEYRQIKLG